MAMEHRGNDATGILVQQADGSIAVAKEDVPAWKFCSGAVFENFVGEHLKDDSRCVLLHTRAATQGSPRDMKNNHPLFNGLTGVVHNGVVYNDNALFTQLDLERNAEVDSDIFRAILDKHGISDEGLRLLNRVSGSAAIAAVDTRQPGKLLIARSGSPLTLGSTPDHFCFASEKHIIHRAMRPWVKRWGMEFQVQSLQMAFMPFPDDTAWVLGPQGLEFHREFNVLNGVYRKPTYRVNEGYKTRQARWDSATAYLLPKRVICPGCKKALTLTEEQRKGTLASLHCDPNHNGCGHDLAGAKSAG